MPTVRHEQRRDHLKYNDNRYLRVDGPAQTVSTNIIINSIIQTTGLTASRIVLTDASQNLVSSAAGSSPEFFSWDNTWRTIYIDYVGNPLADKTFTMANKTVTWRFTNPSGGMAWEFTGAATGHSLNILQTGGNPSTDMHLLHIEAEDVDPTTLHLSPGASTSRALMIDASGDSGPGRLNIYGSGEMEWGNGTNPIDVTFKRDSSGVLSIISKSSTSTDARFNLRIKDITPQASGVGGGIVFEGCYADGSENTAIYAGIKANKTNGTSGQYGGELHLQTRANGSSPATALKIDEDRNVYLIVVNEGSSPHDQVMIWNDLTGVVQYVDVSAVEVGYVAGVTSSIQAQLNAKLDAANISGSTNYLPIFTGSNSIGNSAINDNGTTYTLTSRRLNISATDNVELIKTYGSGTSFLSMGLVGNDVYWTAGSDASNNTNMYFRIAASGTETTKMFLRYDGRFAVGTLSPEGTIHAWSGSAGSVTADEGANELVLENNENVGAHFLCPDAYTGNLYFGTPSDSVGALVRWDYSNLLMKIGNSISGGEVSIVTASQTEAIRIDDSQNVAFKGNVVEHNLPSVYAGAATKISKYMGSISDTKGGFLLFAKKYAGSFLNKQGFCGEIQVHRGKTDAYLTTEIVRVTCVTAYNDADLTIEYTSSGEQIQLVEVTYSSEVYYGVWFAGNASAATRGVYINGLLFNSLDPIFINDDTSYSPTQVDSNNFRRIYSSTFGIGESNDSIRLYINGDGDTGFATTSPGAKVDIAYGGMTMLLGALADGTARTDSEIKITRIGHYHYTNSEEPLCMMYAYVDSSSSNVFIGGGTTYCNAATIVSIVTASNTTTQSGTERFRVDSSGHIYMFNLSGTTGGSDLRYNTSTKEIFYDTSALKYKENVRVITDTSWIYDIPVVTYDRKDKKRINEIGIIADDIARVRPDYCSYDENGNVESYSKSDLVPVLLAEIQKMKQEIDKLKSEVINGRERS